MKTRQQTRLLTLAALASVLLVALSRPVQASITDPAYHTLQEVNDRIFFIHDSLQNVGGAAANWLRIDSIGYSQAEHLPIYCVRITNNVDDTALNKPAVVLVGQVHAEEVLGVELVLRIIPKILATPNWRNTIDVYIVPTANPEGLSVVYSLDNTYRKNKRDNIGDGRFRYNPGWGLDTSGVDLNRNFPFFWPNGAYFLQNTVENEFYDYYRGPGPLSEPEMEALDRLIDRVRPLYSVVYHSSRTGKVAEQVIYPWDYGNKTKQCPDQAAYDYYANEVAKRCRKLGEEKEYERVRILNAQGDCEAYLYWKYGVFAIRIEIGKMNDEGMQPDSIPDEFGVSKMYKIFDDVKGGLEYVLMAASSSASDGLVKSRLDFLVRDAETLRPLYAKIKLDKISKPMIPFRTTNPRSGKYRWLVYNGFADSATVSCFGYVPWRRTVSATTSPTLVGGQGGVRLVPLMRRNVNFNLNDGALAITRDIELIVTHPDSTIETTIINGTGSLVLPEGQYELTLLGGWDYVPRRVNVTVSSDTTYNISLSRASILLDQTFDAGDMTYTSDNLLNRTPDHTGTDSTARWELTEVVYHSHPRAITESRRGATFRFEDAWMAPYNMFDQRLDLRTSATASLVYWLNQALEPGYDSMWVEAAVGAGDPASLTWSQIAPSHQELSTLIDVPERPWNANTIPYQRYGEWDRFVVPLDSFCGNDNVHIRFRIRTDATLQEDGVYLDDIMILGSGDAPPAISSVGFVPNRFALGQPYPNPFNGRFQVSVALPEAGMTKIGLYDLTGRLVIDYIDQDLPAGTRILSVDASNLAAGLYILRATGPNMSRPEIRKITLVK